MPDVIPAANCYDQWLSGTIRFGTPIEIPNVNATAYDRDPYVTPDERELYFSSTRLPDSMSSDIWVAKRPNTTTNFSTPAIATEFQSGGGESKVSFTADGKLAVLGSSRGTTDVDVWQFERDSITDPWGTATQTHLTAVNTNGNDHDPTISADGLRLYLAPDGGTQDIAVATRTLRADDFGAPQVLATLSSGMGDADPSPSLDERIIVYASGRTSTPMPGNVWYATRANSSVPFGAPVIVPDVNTDAPEGDPHLSTDGCRLYFARLVDVPADDWDLYVATALP